MMDYAIAFPSNATEEEVAAFSILLAKLQYSSK